MFILKHINHAGVYFLWSRLYHSIYLFLIAYLFILFAGRQLVADSLDTNTISTVCPLSVRTPHASASRVDPDLKFEEVC